MWNPKKRFWFSARHFIVLFQFGHLRHQLPKTKQPFIQLWVWSEWGKAISATATWSIYLSSKSKRKWSIPGFDTFGFEPPWYSTVLGRFQGQLWRLARPLIITESSHDSEDSHSPVSKQPKDIAFSMFSTFTTCFDKPHRLQRNGPGSKKKHEEKSSWTAVTQADMPTWHQMRKLHQDQCENYWRNLLGICVCQTSMVLWYLVSPTLT